MTRVETAEIFALLMLAHPQTDMFRAENQAALEAKLASTVTLWATCLKDVDFWTVQQTTILLCQRCKFPPTIAEIRETAADVAARTRNGVEWVYMTARGEVNSLWDGEELEAAYQRFSPRCRKTIDAMGRVDVFASSNRPFFNMTGSESTYERLLRANPVGLPGQNARQIAGQRLGVAAVDYSNRTWACPFFRWDERYKVHREGGYCASFPGRKMAQEYATRYCASVDRWRTCTMAAALLRYYERAS